ncbi:inorganic diphosphatase [Candidatus Nardonella dryophthoridicola]|uniref:inorganic diphosphatase n=1 Tax=endosymbiont of Metamasius hemipterus TaxID=204627 RepID=A0ABT0TWB8_9GAMM|nr:inorganic diphosphatase [Candidatus Nardonella dryophthoridicola]MCM0158287.1 inorganic diphosphatase [endosymbiont of Metamasius hemipterus]
MFKENIPNSIYVIIEIPYYNNNIKYEIKNNKIYVDRFIKTPLFFPFNYGYINNTLSLDGDKLDVIIPINYKLQIGSIILCKPVALILMEDENGEDNKIIAFPNNEITDEYNNINDLNDIPHYIINKIDFFLKNYKNLELNKFTIIKNYKNSNFAKEEILKSIYRFKNKNKIK